MKTNGNKQSDRSIFLCPIVSIREVGESIFVLRFHSPHLARLTLPGQFVNIRVVEGSVPLLRRPFSVYHTEGDFVDIIFNTVGRGTQILARKSAGETIDILGPLGHPYGLERNFDTALLVAGGLGVAPLPMITKFLLHSEKPVHTFLGARTQNQIVVEHLKNVSLATDDGSRGFHGTVVDLLTRELADRRFVRPKIYACGPNGMLKNLAELAASYDISCEVSLECVMACGFGICQGCPVQMNHEQGHNDHRKKYELVCKDGPVFNTQEICIET